jgi:hypothetical protein
MSSGEELVSEFERLEPLTPPERSAFLLHDVFGCSFAEVAGIVGRTHEVGLAPEPFDAATTGQDLRDRSDPRACPRWARLRKWSAVAAKLSCCRVADDRRPGRSLNRSYPAR